MAETQGAGWYPDAYGWRWWDGSQWGPYAAPPPSGGSRPSQLGMWCHLGALLANLVAGGFGWIVPLVFYNTKADDRFVRHHASESLNIQLNLLALSIGGVLLAFVGLVGILPAFSVGGGGAFAVLIGVFVLVWVLLVGASITVLVWQIMASIRANRGEWYTYPFCLRWVKGQVPPEEQYPVW